MLRVTIYETQLIINSVRSIYLLSGVLVQGCSRLKAITPDRTVYILFVQTRIHAKFFGSVLSRSKLNKLLWGDKNDNKRDLLRFIVWYVEVV